MGALDTAVRSGRALYVGISSYGPRHTEEAIEILRQLGTPLLIHQPSYSMFNRWIEPELLEDRLGDALDPRGVGRLALGVGIVPEAADGDRVGRRAVAGEADEVQVQGPPERVQARLELGLLVNRVVGSGSREEAVGAPVGDERRDVAAQPRRPAR